MSIVSVVVPIYNGGDMLHKCIRSILKQTFADIEIILVNDGSKDHSLAVCKAYMEQDNRIKLIDQENKGSILSRRRGIETAQSPFIMFVDADDWIDRRMIEILYTEAIKDNIDIMVSNLYKVLDQCSMIRKKVSSWYFNEDKIYEYDDIKEKLASAFLFGHHFPPVLSAKLYKRELLLSCGNYLSTIRFFGDDLYYNLEMFLKADKVKVIREPLYYYRTGGHTSRYMPYLFEDAVNGYEIQKRIIMEFYGVDDKKHENGIRIMLLNTFRTCLRNLFLSGELTESQIRQSCYEYCHNSSIVECVNDKVTSQYFKQDYIEAISTYNVDYLYRLGQSLFKNGVVKAYALKAISNLFK